MKSRKDITEVLPAWASAKARENKTTLAWVEYTAAAIDSRVKWQFADSHIKTAAYGLGLQQVIAPTPTATLVLAGETVEKADAKESKDEKPVESPKPTVFPCLPGETIIAAARRIQTNAQEEQNFILSGSVVLSCAAKIDLKQEAKPGAHKKWTISIQEIMADLKRYAELQDEALVSAADKAAFQEVLNNMMIAEEKVSFGLPIAEITEQNTQVAAAKPTRTHSGILGMLGLRGRQGKGAPTTTNADASAQSKNDETNVTAGMK